ncbi:cytochrome P450 4V2-like [Phymastichus coffea]|uniref:cytochrome P450 4V2-like n=1 Tax=Phymastichus coffea TaxID=108790 RepID=UPI00273BDF4F|nr:cytochrome P450 4V2-like [Phymastichus coffea]
MTMMFIYRRIMGYIPGPKTLPFVGLSWKLSRIPIEDRFRWLNDLCFSFERGIVVTWFGMKPVVNIRKPWLIQIMLSSYSLMAKSNAYSMLIPWLNNGILTSSGNAWLYCRHLISPAYGFDAIKCYVEIMNKNSIILDECLDKEIKFNSKAPVNILSLITKYSLDTIYEIAVGLIVNTQQTEGNLYTQTLYKFYQICIERSSNLWSQWNSRFYQATTKKMIMKDIQVMHNFIDQIIRNKISINNGRMLMEQDSRSPEQIKFKTFLDHLLEYNENSENPMTLQEMRQEIETLIFTGHGTISAAVTWTLFALGNELKVQENVHKELNTIFDHSNNAIDIEQLEKIKYLDRVIQEVLRIYPSISSIVRCIENDAVIDNFFIPKGTNINIQIYQLHHDPEIWKNPEIFDPDRFLPENSNGRHSYAYIPFSAGPRHCIGQKLAFIEIKIVLITILRKWRVFSLLKPYELKFISNFTLRPSNNKIELYFQPLLNA